LTPAPTQNFFTSISASQRNISGADIDSLDPAISQEAAILNRVDIFFTAIFATELLINIFSHWFLPFASDGWNQLDVVVVSLSLAALGPVTMPANAIRVVRALRVVRLFGRMKSLRNILGALSKSILPVSNALLVLFIVASICQCCPPPPPPPSPFLLS
jgi:hypothetical protein